MNKVYKEIQVLGGIRNDFKRSFRDTDIWGKVTGGMGLAVKKEKKSDMKRVWTKGRYQEDEKCNLSSSFYFFFILFYWYQRKRAYGFDGKQETDPTDMRCKRCRLSYPILLLWNNMNMTFRHVCHAGGWIEIIIIYNKERERERETTRKMRIHYSLSTYLLLLFFGDSIQFDARQEKRRRRRRSEHQLFDDVHVHHDRLDMNTRGNNRFVIILFHHEIQTSQNMRRRGEVLKKF